MTASPDEELAVRLLDADDPRHVEARKLANVAILRLTRERDEAGERERELQEALIDAQDRGLIYWEPNTERGHVEKSLMLARIDRLLKTSPSAAAQRIERMKAVCDAAEDVIESPAVQGPCGSAPTMIALRTALAALDQPQEPTP